MHEVRTRVEDLPKPRFSYAYQFADDIRGDGDGRVEPSEEATLHMRIKNIGEGTAYDTHANLQNLSGRGILLRDGRFNIGELKSGETKEIRFTFRVLGDYQASKGKFEVSIADAASRISVRERLELRLTKKHADAIEPFVGECELGPKVRLLARPAASSDVVAASKRKAKLPASAQTKDYVRLEVPSGRPLWVKRVETHCAKKKRAKKKRAKKKRAKKKRVKAARSQKNEDAIRYFGATSPPRLEAKLSVDLVTSEDHALLEGTASDDSLVRDVYVYAGAKKVFYHSNRSARNPKSTTFKVRVPLHGGTNYISVFVHENDETVTRRLFVVRRDAKDGSYMKTPKLDDDVSWSPDVHGTE